jgi:hypothetical protein
MADSARPLTDLFSIFGHRRPAPTPPAASAPTASAVEPAHPTKALQKFLTCLQGREKPVLVDLGPVVGANVTFFGEQLGCRIRVEDLASDIDAHVKRGAEAELSKFLATRFTQAPGSVDGVLCWDVIDYLDRAAAQTLASVVGRMLRPEGALLGFFSTAEAQERFYTKYVVVDHQTLRYRTYPASRPRQRALLNGDIIRLFKDLRVSDSFLMKTKVREMLFRKPVV